MNCEGNVAIFYFQNSKEAECYTYDELKFVPEEDGYCKLPSEKIIPTSVVDRLLKNTNKMQEVYMKPKFYEEYSPDKVNWGGFIQSIKEQYTENEIFDLDERIQILISKLRRIELAKDFNEIKQILPKFTQEEIDYLNSPLLDDILKFKNRYPKDLNLKSSESAKFIFEKMILDEPGDGQNSKDEMMLTLAVKSRDINLVKKILLIKYDSSLFEDKNYMEMLNFLVEKGDSTVVSFYPDTRYETGRFIIYSIKNYSNDEHFIEIFKNMKLDTPQGLYFLDAAAKFGKINIIKILLDRGEISGHENDALFTAVENGQIDTVLFLLENGATVNNMIRSSLEIAKERGHTNIVNFFKEKYNIEI